ncbi:choice-of-anchor Q domain-containing protein, partial [Porticoccus sp.]
ISGNTTTGGGASEGGGLFNRGTATLTNVTLSGNSAGLGGGIHNDSTGGASIDLTNVTISGNTATGAEGGGIHNENTATLTNVTVSNNSAATQGGGVYTTGTVTISNSILANNTAGGSGPDAFGTFSSDGTNIIENIAPASGFGSDTSGDPNLGALANNGGFTQTHALLGGSIAIDAGTNLNAPPLDQRGYLRTDGLADSGAFEAGATAPGANYVVINTNASGAGSLEWAIDQANLSVGFDIISFNIAGSGPHVISVDSDGLPSISDSVLIDGWSEPDYVNTPVIRIDAGTFPGVNGLWLNSGSDGSIIRGLSITGFTGNDAIEVTSSGNTIVGNYIGLATDGTTVDGNDTGIRIRQGASDNQIGGTGEADQNLIAGNSYAGIAVLGNNSDNNRIIGNDIGLDASATVVNTGTFGIVIWNRPDGTQIGGTADGEGNRIAGFNKAVVIDSNPQAATNTSILGNQIWGSTQLGIDLENDGISYNDAGDADAGANNQLNFPVFSKVTQNGSNLDVDLLLDVPAGNYRLELFENPAGINASGHGEGQVFLGAVTLVSAGTGVQAFSTGLTGVVVGDVNTVAATVTEDFGGGSFGNTSEFSQAPGLPVLIRDEFNNPAYSGNDGHLPWANDWQEIGESDGPVWDTITTSAVSVWSNFGDDGLDLWAANNLGAWREADLTFASSATLSFDWAMLNTEAGDSVSLQVSTDGGVGWTTLDTFDGPLNHGSTQAASYDISAYIDNDTRIKFETVSGFESDDEFFVDNVQIAMTRYESTLWLSTNGSASDNNGAVSGSGKQVVSLDDPDLNYEWGDGSTDSSDGTFSTEYTLAENVRAMHYVNTNVTVDTYIGGATGTYNLQPGQIVVSMRAADTLDFSVPTLSSGTLMVNNNDVLVYTPSTGLYEFLLEDTIYEPDVIPKLANIHAISIVEQDTTIGVDTTLAAGTYLIARSDPDVHDNISTYDNTNGLRDLLDGELLLGGSGNQIQGLELLESNLTLGNIALNKGTLLITVNNSTTVGTGTTVSAERVDVVALTINATEQDSASPATNVDAQIFFDGSDIALSIASSKEINGLTLVGNNLNSTVNSEPTLSASASNPTFTEGGAAASLFSSASADTIESGQSLSALTLTVTNVNDGASEILNTDGSAIALTHGNSGTTATNSLSYSVSLSGGTATVTLSGGSLSTTATETLVDAISYQNNSNDPNTSNRVVTITSLQDSGGTANSGDDTAALSIASTVTVQTVNDEPTLTASASNPTFTEGGAATSLFSSASADTIESGQSLSALTLTVTNVNDG